MAVFIVLILCAVCNITAISMSHKLHRKWVIDAVLLLFLPRLTEVLWKISNDICKCWHGRDVIYQSFKKMLLAGEKKKIYYLTCRLGDININVRVGYLHT